MLNRISLLEQEENKIRKKIELTQKKTKDIMQNKDANDHHYIERLRG